MDIASRQAFARSLRGNALLREIIEDVQQTAFKRWISETDPGLRDSLWHEVTAVRKFDNRIANELRDILQGEK